MPLLGTMLLSLVACSTAPVLPPDDDRLFELVETDLWSGGELRAVVRYAEGEEPFATIVLDGDTLTVARVDDTTFAASLPVHTGALAVRVERDDLDPVKRMVTLHGFMSGVLGPAVGGAFIPRADAGGRIVLGSTFEGAAEVSLDNAQVIRTWPLSVQSVRCSGGIVPGPVPGHVIVRSGSGETHNCEFYRSRPYDAAGLGPSTDDVVLGFTGLSAILGPGTVLSATPSQWAVIHHCTIKSIPWSGCEAVAVNVSGSMVGYGVGYLARRIIPLARRSAIHDLQTGDVVAALPETPALVYYTAAAFSASEDSVYLGANGPVGSYVGSPGAIIAVSSATGAVLDELVLPDGVPVALAVDDARHLLLAVIQNRNEGKLWLQVRSRTDHAIVAELPVSDARVIAAAKHHHHFRLLQQRVRNQVVLVATEQLRPYHSTPILPMVIARWTLPPE